MRRFLRIGGIEVEAFDESVAAAHPHLVEDVREMLLHRSQVNVSGVTRTSSLLAK
jgi:hypothetical protein